jgi:hypothetical protein
MLRSGGVGRAARACSLLIGMSTACTAIDNPPTAEPSAGLDEAVFRCRVEPVLARQCSYSACHGLAGTALRIYTPGKLRAAPAKDLDAAIAPLTDAEHHANYLSAAGFHYDAADPLENLLLRKTIPSNEGGYAHEGGVIFESTADAQWIVIHDWLTGTGRCP